VEQGTRVEIDINNLRTMMTVFFKDSKAMSPGELKEAPGMLVSNPVTY
jgi:hypothetical protein